MSLFQQAAQLNNEGIAFLVNGNQKAAIGSMSQAIKLLKAELSQTDPSTLKYDSSAVYSQGTQTVEITCMESSDTIVFNQAIQIPAHDNELTQFDLNIHTCAVIFNLALAHHFEGDAVCLAKAEKLYGMVLKLLNGSALNVHTALVAKLACINNLSQIRYSRGDYKNAQEGLSQVSGFIRQSLSNQAVLEEPDIQGLLMNALLLRAPKVAAAA